MCKITLILGNIYKVQGNSHSTDASRTAKFKLYTFSTYLASIQCFQGCLCISNIIVLDEPVESPVRCFSYLHSQNQELINGCFDTEKTIIDIKIKINHLSYFTIGTEQLKELIVGYCCVHIENHKSSLIHILL